MNAELPPFVVKVCGITNEEDARVAVEAGANALGFNFYSKSSRYIKPERARQIVQAVRGEYLSVGVFVNRAEEELMEIAGRVPLDVVQLHGEEYRLPLSKPYRVWRSISPGAKPKEELRVLKRIWWIRLRRNSAVPG